MRRILGLCLLVFSMGLEFADEAFGDDSRPLYVEITEIEESTYTIRLQIPPTIDAFNAPTLNLPEDCVEVANPALQATLLGGATRRPGGETWFRCENGLAGEMVSLRYPAYAPSNSTLVRVTFLTGEEHALVLGPWETEWQIPEAETVSRVARDYTLIGIHHIWAGRDHLLFLACLLWIAGSFRRVLTTITGFTVAHSITLVLSALEIVRLPIAPVEAAIALSVVFLAVEIAKGRRNTLTWRYPIAVSSSFGLLHGLGFAAVLNEIGLPQTELVTGLLFFNVGVEIGQVLFAATVLAAIYVAKKAAGRWTGKTDVVDRLQVVLSYGVGCTASYWLIERTLNFVEISPF